jgi:hypothetical protein
VSPYAEERIQKPNLPAPHSFFYTLLVFFAIRYGLKLSFEARSGKPMTYCLKHKTFLHRRVVQHSPS